MFVHLHFVQSASLSASSGVCSLLFKRLFASGFCAPKCLLLCSYFLCRLKALSTELKPCPREIAEAVWMPIQEFLSAPAEVGILNRVAVCLAAGLPLPADYKPQPLQDATPEQTAGAIAEHEMGSLLYKSKMFKVYHAATPVVAQK